MSQFLRVPRLDSIKGRILTLAVLGTLLPAGVTLGVAYNQTRQALKAKITDDLVSESSQTARGVSVWLKERLIDLRVFASSDEVETNLGRSTSQGAARLRDYLHSVHERVPGFEELLVLDANGRLLASSEQRSRAVQLPSEWKRTLRTTGQVVGDPFWDEKASMVKLIVAVPVHRADGNLMGALGAELSLAPVRQVVREFARDTAANNVYLVSDSGNILTGTRHITRRLLDTRVTRPTLARLATRENQAVTYVNFARREVMGTLTRVPQTQWSVIAEMPSDVAFGQVRQFRDLALVVGALVLLVVAGTAYRLGTVIVRPLERLAEGASEVARGALDVDLPESGRVGEVGALTKVFNEMVQRLRAGRQELANANASLRSKNEELERLSVTDGLTGLVNHRALMQRLTEEGTRSQRNKRAFSVIMCDVDHFKQYNDEFGHPAGDDVLKLVGSILKDSTRTVDCAARYGGEEFALLLPETEATGAMEVAERIRARVQSSEFPGRRITVSLGVAEFPTHARTAAEVVVAADKALYEAKRGGRNQVVRATATKERKLPSSRSTPKSLTARRKS